MHLVLYSATPCRNVALEPGSTGLYSTNGQFSAPAFVALMPAPTPAPIRVHLPAPKEAVTAPAFAPCPVAGQVLRGQLPASAPVPAPELLVQAPVEPGMSHLPELLTHLLHTLFDFLRSHNIAALVSFDLSTLLNTVEGTMWNLLGTSLAC